MSAGETRCNLHFNASTTGGYFSSNFHGYNTSLNATNYLSKMQIKFRKRHLTPYVTILDTNTRESHLISRQIQNVECHRFVT